MEEMRYAAHLLNCTIDNVTCLTARLLVRSGRTRLKNLAQHHFGHGEVLSQPIVQVARDAPSFLILHRHQPDGKTPQCDGSLINHLFQFRGIIANRLLDQFAVMDIGTGTVPSGDLSNLISDRHGAGAEPVIASVFSAQAIFHFVILTRSHTVEPTLLASLPVVGMQVIPPAEANRRAWRSTGIFIKSVADGISAAVLLSTEDD